MSTDVSAPILGYREFLKKRDGEADIVRPSLSCREQFFDAIEMDPVRSGRRFDREVFLRNITRSKLDDDLDPEMLWLVFTARSNQSERFGVELSRLYGHGALDFDAPEEEVHPTLQEFYHTRILADELCRVGLIQEQLGPLGRKVMHGIYRGMAKAELSSRSPLPRIFGPERVREAFDSPFELRKMARQFPEQAYVF